MKTLSKSTQTLGALILVLAGTSVTAQEEKPREERLTSTKDMYAIVDAGLPEVLSQDNSELLAQLLSPKLGEPLAETFSVERATQTLFSTSEPINGECDEETNVCDFFAGEAAGKGNYRKLSVHKGDSSLSVRYANRETVSDTISPVSLSDKEAYNLASKLLVDTLGVPTEEIPLAPANAKYRLPVKTVNMAYADGKGEQGVLPVEKLIKVQRGLYVGGELGWVPGPGKLAVALSDKGVSSATIRSWADMSRYGAGLNPNDAKSRTQLTEELVARFQEEGIARLSSARSLLAISLLEGASTPVPVLRVFASPQPRDLDEASQAAIVSSAGVVIELPLIALNDDDLSQGESE